jgi:carbamoylphosphate synthase large subunit
MSGVDTRGLTRHLRTEGTIDGQLLLDGDERGTRLVRPATVDMSRVLDLVPSPRVTYFGNPRQRVLLIDTGTKESIVRHLVERGATVTRVPWNQPWDTHLDEADGLVLTNGPGDPTRLADPIQVERIAGAMSRDHDRLLRTSARLHRLQDPALGSPEVRRSRSDDRHRDEVGEVMGIGRTFPEALQKALRMLDIGIDGLDPRAFEFPDLCEAIRVPSPRRVFAVARGLAEGMSSREIADLTAIDPFFLDEIARVIHIGTHVSELPDREPHAEQRVAFAVALAKRAGFSDRALATQLKRTEEEVTDLRRRYGLAPRLAQIETVAAEYPAETNYLYLTYGTERSDVAPSSRKKVLVLGSGPYRIGSSLEFDWCAVNAVMEARALGYDTLLLNCNPETVSTDYDVCDRLIFDEITVESVLALCELERPDAVIVSVGGQTPNNLVMALHRAGVKLLGTPATSIDIAESRDKFSTLLDTLGIGQPRWAPVDSDADLNRVVDSVGGYPVLVRPSYVLSGAAMRVVWSDDTLHEYVGHATRVSPEHPVVISKFEENAQEIELDAVARHGELIVSAISEHVERAGVHSESGAFELAYNIFGGKKVPVFFAIWKQAPIETTLLRDLDDLVSIRYITFADPMELKEPLSEFIKETANGEAQRSIRRPTASDTATDQSRTAPAARRAPEMEEASET